MSKKKDANLLDNLPIDKEKIGKAGVSMFQDFKKFISKGNVLDMAVGVVIATAFGAITSTLVANVIMPLVGLLLGGIDFSTLSVTLKGINGQEVPMQYGLFIQAVVDFFVIAISVFLVVRILTIKKRRDEAIEAAKKKAEEEEAAAKAAAEPKAPTTEELLAEIRDLLAKNAK